MRFPRILYFTGCLIFLSINLAAQNLKQATDDQKKEIINETLKSSKTTVSLECKFIQKKNLSMLSETVVSEGVMYFKKDNNLRWQYNKPYVFIFILSGNKVFIKNDKRIDKFDTSTNKMFKEISDIMIGGVNGSLLLDCKKFTSKYFYGSTVAEVQLIPKDKQLRQLFNQINICFSKSDWVVKSIEMEEVGGDNTIISFTDKNVNGKISNDLFRIN